MSPLAFEVTGPPLAPAVLFLHGFMGSRRDWSAVAGALARTHRCIAVDLPGHGETGDPGNNALWTPEGCIAALADILASDVANVANGGNSGNSGNEHHTNAVTPANAGVQEHHNRSHSQDFDVPQNDGECQVLDISKRPESPSAVACAPSVKPVAGRSGVSVVGYSLGGRLALQLAIEHPDLVARAVIISASPGIAAEPTRRTRRDEDEHRAHRLETLGLEPFLEDWYRQPLFTALRENPRFTEVLERRRRNDARLLARSLRSMGTGTQRSLWGDLPGLRTPLLFLAGERDATFTTITFDAVALCPRAEAVVLRGCGHALVEEEAAAVTGETTAFLACGR